MPTPPISYVTGDFPTIMEALKLNVQARFGDVWKSWYESDIGVCLAEMVAFCWDQLNFYVNLSANEQFITTARDKSSMIRLGKLVGYRLRPATSAAVVCDASIATAQLHDVIVPAGTEATSGTGVIFRTLIDQRIPTGSTSASLVFTEGAQHTETFTSNGTAFQTFVLSLPEVIYGSVTVTVNSTPWAITDSLVYGESDSLIYTIDYDETDFATLQTGDNTNGAIPPVGSIVSVTYRVGGGVQGNILVGGLSTSVEGYLDGVSPTTNVSVSVTNNEQGSGGIEPESIEHARLWIPRWVATNGRAVTQQDFNTLANVFNDPTYGSPAMCSAWLTQSIPELNQVTISVWALDYGSNITESSTGLKSAISNYFNNNGPGAIRLICTDVVVEDGEIVYIDIAAVLTVSGDYASAGVTSQASAAINNYFSTSMKIQPGVNVYLSDLYSIIQAVPGVENSLIEKLIASKKAQDLLGTGTGAQANFAGTLDLPPGLVGLPLVPSTVQITASGMIVTDDGNGKLIGDVNPSGTNTVNYATLAYDVTFSSAPGSGDSIQAAFRYILDYSRWEQIATGDGTKQTFTGVITWPPILPFQTGYAQKGITFSDGSQTFRDDGTGKIVNPDTLYEVGTVDYDSGAFSLTFPVPPANEIPIVCAYSELLQTASENIPIGKNQVAVPGVYYLSTQVGS